MIIYYPHLDYPRGFCYPILKQNCGGIIVPAFTSAAGGLHVKISVLL